MKLKRSFRLALNILFHSKLRSWLTIIGIVIGIAAVVAIISISLGAQQQLESRLGSLGANVITVSPGFSQARGFAGGFRVGSLGGGGESASSTTPKNLTSKDILALKATSNVEYVMGSVSGSETLTYSTQSATVGIQGVDASVWPDITTEQISSGRLLDQSDLYSVVIGGDLVTTVFPNGIPLNAKVTIDGEAFQVVGILQSGRTVYMPIAAAKQILNEVGEDYFDSISVKITNVNLANDTVNTITNNLMLERGILNNNKRDFSVSNPAQEQATVESTVSTMSLFLGAIAAISLLVGAIGIANTMFTSVLEKTREIGIMKAIGAKNREILTIFLFNSGLIGLVGGLGGIILGSIGSGFISVLESSSSGTSAAGAGGVGRLLGNTAITPGLLIAALAIAVIIGMIAGAIPAYRASKLNPVDALRYE